MQDYYYFTRVAQVLQEVVDHLESQGYLELMDYEVFQVKMEFKERKEQMD